jgi:hypothetical protein
MERIPQPASRDAVFMMHGEGEGGEGSHAVARSEGSKQHAHQAVSGWRSIVHTSQPAKHQRFLFKGCSAQGCKLTVTDGSGAPVCACRRPGHQPDVGGGRHHRQPGLCCMGPWL